MLPPHNIRYSYGFVLPGASPTHYAVLVRDLRIHTASDQHTAMGQKGGCHNADQVHPEPEEPYRYRAEGSTVYRESSRANYAVASGDTRRPLGVAVHWSG